MIAKPLVAAVVLTVMRYPIHTVLTVPSALAQIGEFSFILAAVARDLSVLPEVGLHVVVAVSIASILLNPLAAKAIRPVEAWLSRLAVVPEARHRRNAGRARSSVIAAA